MKKLIEEKIRKKGLRMTYARRHILDILKNSEKPMTALDIERAFKRSNLPDRATVYRQMHTLLREKIIVKADVLGRAEYYELNTKHHHHFVCDECGDSVCLDEPLSERFIQKIEKNLKKQGLFVGSHSIAFSGMCTMCHNK